MKKKETPYMVEDIMIASPKIIHPEASILDAMNTMRENKIGCLPVVNEGDLIGIITEMDFLRISARLIERLEK
ncbi:MAG: CBS domain-containing protein [Saprospiraceae bacterium]